MSKVSFGGSVAYTKNGNPYEKSRTWTWVGLGVGSIGGIANGIKNKPINENLLSKLNQTNKFLAPLAIGTIIGGVIDTFINHSRKKAADETAQYYDNQESLDIKV